MHGRLAALQMTTVTCGLIVSDLLRYDGMHSIISFGGVVGSTLGELWGAVDFSPTKPVLVNLGGGNTQRHTRAVFCRSYFACQG